MSSGFATRVAAEARVGAINERQGQEVVQSGDMNTPDSQYTHLTVHLGMVF